MVEVKKHFGYNWLHELFRIYIYEQLNFISKDEVVLQNVIKTTSLTKMLLSGTGWKYCTLIFDI